MDLFLANANGLTKHHKACNSGRMEPSCYGTIVGLARNRQTHSDTVGNLVAELLEQLARKPRKMLGFLDHAQDQLTVQCCRGAGLGLPLPPNGDRPRLELRWRSETPDMGNSVNSDLVESAGKA